MIGRLHGIVIDCPDPSGLASFCQRPLGMIRVRDDGDWVVIGDAPDQPGLALTRAEGFAAPTWPDPEVQQQVHFDVLVDDLDAAEMMVVQATPTCGSNPSVHRRMAWR
jgi:Glyoxalase-like domain